MSGPTTGPKLGMHRGCALRCDHSDRATVSESIVMSCTKSKVNKCRNPGGVGVLSSAHWHWVVSAEEEDE